MSAKIITKTKTGTVKKSASKTDNTRLTKRSICDKTTTTIDEAEISWLTIYGANEHNLKNINVSFPIGALSVVTGVSGSGKSSLVHDIIWKSLTKNLHHNTGESQVKVKSIAGINHLNKIININQQPIGLSPTSNPATYTGMFDLIRELFAKLPESKLRGYTARRFSFNVPDGRCEKCEGAGQIKIEMHFLPDVWITCDACNGKRYDRQTLDVKYHGYSIADVLELTCADALKLFSNIPKIQKTLKLLCDVGLDYLALGQSAPTLSGGESQRIKLTAELTRPDTGRTLYLLDEPTTGLHFDDMNKLLHVIHRLVDLGNTVIIIEHNLDIIKNADWIVDLGPEAGDNGGYLLFEGTPEELVNSKIKSYTAEALKPALKNGLYKERKKFNPENINETNENYTEYQNDELNDKMPWEQNGLKWHTENHLARNGNATKWDGKILLEIINQIEKSKQFTQPIWNHKSIVEIYPERKSLGWFLHATTSDEWLLKVKFRTAGGTFKRNSLIAALALKPLNEIDSIPLYGAEPRVKLQRQTIQWQEIELQLHSFDEINKPQFYDFLNTAINEFTRFTKTKFNKNINENVANVANVENVENVNKKEDLMPWKVLGKKWHFLQRGLTGGDKTVWDTTLLNEIFNILQDAAPDANIVWTNKTYVQLFRENKNNNPQNQTQNSLWITVWTKQIEAIQLDIRTEKNQNGITLLLKKIEDTKKLKQILNET
ncbi:MAG: ATP-binding cassette domain-containing protein [Planctomycetaceae bacterium]|nr:ATP-binding cassette domain-containing protein [Planctomycetaceae bacterium]